MNPQSQRYLQLLEAVERESDVTQRTLAARLGIALGLTNLYLKRMIRKGYIKGVMIRPNRLAYLITPRGVAQKARLTYEFMRYSLDLYRDARREVALGLDLSMRGQQRVAMYGTGEAAELAFLLLKERNVDLVAVFGDQPGGQFLGLPVRELKGHHEVAFDVMIVAVLEKPERTCRALQRAGVPREKMLRLRAGR